jgi:transcriptional regulator with XRE-family HTH domain
MSAERLTQAQLADALHINVRTIQRWEKLAAYPKNPTPENVATWRAEQKPRARDDLEQLKCDKLQQDIEIGELKAARLRREQIRVEQVDALSRLIGQKLSLLLRQKVEVELPGRVLGKPIAEINAECAAAADEMREIVNGNLADYGRLDADE